MWYFLLSMYSLDTGTLLQHITIEGKKKKIDGFGKNNITVKYGEAEEVNLDDIGSVFDDNEVGCCLYSLASLFHFIQTTQGNIVKVTISENTISDMRIYIYVYIYIYMKIYLKVHKSIVRLQI